jgi:site-specific recombinase XerC
MRTQRPHINRVLSRGVAATTQCANDARADAPRKLGETVIDFSSLPLPPTVRCALADAFWNQVDVRSEHTVRTYWHHLKIFARFVMQTHAVEDLSDLGSALLVQYIEWLNKQQGEDGKPWSKGTRYSTYMTLRTMLQWLLLCRPGLLREVEFPINPYPWKNRDVQRVDKLSAQDLRTILKACERDIADCRALREEAEQEIAASRISHTDSIQTRGDLLRLIDEHYGGIVPSSAVVHSRGHCPLQQGLVRHGYIRRVERCLYPRAESLFPYYLAILIHSAGNPQPLAELTADCLQPIPLLDDRELLIWSKARAGAPQRRSFRSTDLFEPPALVRELLQWTRRLRPHASEADRSRLFLYKGQAGVSALSFRMIKVLYPAFVARHHLPHFTFSSIRPSVLTVFYRALGDLRQVKAIANHAHLSTTIGYVEGAEVALQNRVRVAALQSAFVGHLEQAPSGHLSAGPQRMRAFSAPGLKPPAGAAVSMFGFNCKDPFAGIAPGTRVGELCTNFLGCFTCPNAIITADAPSLARLLQARDHLRAANAYLHPARWQAIYAPQLRILEEDILTRFSARELAAAEPLRGSLPPLPELR